MGIRNIAVAVKSLNSFLVILIGYGCLPSTSLKIRASKIDENTMILPFALSRRVYSKRIVRTEILGYT
jgi:hypothetical protein